MTVRVGALLAALLVVQACKRAQPASNPPGGPRGAAKRDGAADSVPAREESPSPIARVLSYVATDSTLTGPDSVFMGLVETRLTNRGSAYHDLRYLRLPDRATLAEAIGYIRETGELPPNLMATGGAGPVAPGGTAVVAQMLRPGAYLVLSGLDARDGKPSFLKGVMRTLTVTGRQPRLMIPPHNPATTGALTTSDRVWRMIRTVPTSEGRTLPVEGRWSERRFTFVTGRILVQVEHFGGSGHSLVVIKGQEPRVMREYVAWLDGASSDHPPILGGIPGLFGQMRAWLHLDVDRGTYFAFCPNYHGSAGVRGFEIGEYEQFMVR